MTDAFLRDEDLTLYVGDVLDVLPTLPDGSVDCVVTSPPYFALQADGWYLRSDIIWAKPNPMPESVTDRPTKTHEYVFLLSKGPRYWFDQEAVREKAAEGTDLGLLRGRTRDDTGMVAWGTTAVVARKHGRHTVGIELNPEYARLAAERTKQLSLLA